MTFPFVQGGLVYLSEADHLIAFCHLGDRYSVRASSAPPADLAHAKSWSESRAPFFRHWAWCRTRELPILEIEPAVPGVSSGWIGVDMSPTGKRRSDVQSRITKKDTSC